MFINVMYKDEPELSSASLSLRMSGAEEEFPPDPSIEHTLLVNPKCPVRIILEYIRNKCKLGIYANFDLCDQRGGLMKLFELPTYAYATHMFEHKRVYYLIVMKQENEGVSIFPQLNHDNPLYEELKIKIQTFLETGYITPESKPSPMKLPPKSAVKGKKK